MAISVHSLTLSSAQVKLLTSTPQTLLAAPASGYVNCIVGVTVKLNWNSIGYAGASTIKFYPGTSTNFPVFQDLTAFIATANAELPVEGLVSLGKVYCTEQALKITADVNPTLGNSTMTFYVIYEVRAII